jgi:hypothetical protein
MPTLAHDDEQRAGKQEEGSKGKRLTCLACRQGKVKCDGGQPCGRCTRLGQPCVATQPFKRSKRQRGIGGTVVLPGATDAGSGGAVSPLGGAPRAKGIGGSGGSGGAPVLATTSVLSGTDSLATYPHLNAACRIKPSSLQLVSWSGARLAPKEHAGIMNLLRYMLAIAMRRKSAAFLSFTLSEAAKLEVTMDELLIGGGGGGGGGGAADGGAAAAAAMPMRQPLPGMGFMSTALFQPAEELEASIVGPRLTLPELSPAMMAVAGALAPERRCFMVRTASQGVSRFYLSEAMKGTFGASYDQYVAHFVATGACPWAHFVVTPADQSKFGATFMALFAQFRELGQDLAQCSVRAQLKAAGGDIVTANVKMYLECQDETSNCLMMVLDKCEVDTGGVGDQTQQQQQQQQQPQAPKRRKQDSAPSPDAASGTEASGSGSHSDRDSNKGSGSDSREGLDPVSPDAMAVVGHLPNLDPLSLGGREGNPDPLNEFDLAVMDLFKFEGPF